MRYAACCDDVKKVVTNMFGSCRKEVKNTSERSGRFDRRMARGMNGEDALRQLSAGQSRRAPFIETQARASLPA